MAASPVPPLHRTTTSLGPSAGPSAVGSLRGRRVSITSTTATRSRARSASVGGMAPATAATAAAAGAALRRMPSAGGAAGGGGGAAAAAPGLPQRTVHVIKSTHLGRGNVYSREVSLGPTATRVNTLFNQIIAKVSEKQGADGVDVSEQLSQAHAGSIKISLTYGRITYTDQNGNPQKLRINIENDGDDVTKLRNQALEALKSVDRSLDSHRPKFEHGCVGNTNSRQKSFDRSASPALQALPTDFEKVLGSYIGKALAPRRGESDPGFQKRRKAACKRIAYAQRIKHKALHFISTKVSELEEAVAGLRKSGSSDELKAAIQKLERYKALLDRFKGIDEFALNVGLSYISATDNIDDRLQLMERDLSKTLTDDSMLEKAQSTVWMRSAATRVKDQTERFDAAKEYLADIAGMTHNDPEEMAVFAEEHFELGHPKAPTIENDILARLVYKYEDGSLDKGNEQDEDAGLAIVSHYLDEDDAEVFNAYIHLSPKEKKSIDRAVKRIPDIGAPGAFTDGTFTRPAALKALIEICRAPRIMPMIPEIEDVEADLTDEDDTASVASGSSVGGRSRSVSGASTATVASGGGSVASPTGGAGAGASPRRRRRSSGSLSSGSGARRD